MAQVAPDADDLFAIAVIAKNRDCKLMNRIKFFLIPAITICGILLAIESQGSNATDPLEVQIRNFSLGFSGNYKLGYWTPAFVSLDAPAGTHLSFLLTTPDGDGVPSTTTVKHTVPPHAVGSTTNVELLCKIGRPDGKVELAIYQGDQPVARKQFSLQAGDYKPLPSTTKLILSLGTSPNLRAATTQQLNAEGPRTVVVEMNEVDQLPAHALGYDGVDQIFCSSSRPIVKTFLARTGSVLAVESWVRWGGNLTLSIGGNETEILAGTNSFEAFLPGDFEKTISVRQLRPIEILGGGSDPLIKEDSRGRSQSFSVPFFNVRNGRVESTMKYGGQSIPLLIRSSLGFGQLTVLAVDTEQPEFKAWNGTRNLIQTILSLTQRGSEKSNLTSGGELAHSGYDDLAGQLRAALDQFAGQGVWFIPFELLFLIGIIYLFLIAAGDYFLLRKLRGRMELTWVSFPLIIILCSAGIYVIARATKGDRQLVNQAEVIDIDMLSGQVRGSCWFSLFSPQTERYDLSTKYQLNEMPQTQLKMRPENRANHATHKMIFSWMGLPGRGLGGMESPLITPMFELGYRYGPQLASLDSVPLSIWSTKCFSIRHKGSGVDAVEAMLSERNSDTDALIEGSITNLMTQPLHDCVLLHNGWAYPLGTLTPNKPHSIDRSQSVRTIRNYLARLGPLEMESDAQRFEVKRIFQRMLFYQAAGGESSSALNNHYLSALDMSHLLENGKAILVGFSDQQLFDIYNGEQRLSDSKSLHGSVYRIVLPIQEFNSHPKATKNSLQAIPDVSAFLFALED